MPAMTNAVECMRFLFMPIASLPSGESRVARNARPNGEHSITQHVTASRRSRATVVIADRPRGPLGRPDAERPLSPPVTANHWYAIA